MNDLLEWISRNGAAAFWVGVFLLILAGIIATAISRFYDFLTELAQARSGNYPPPRPVVECDGDCDCNRPCKCCSEGSCEVGCECSSAVDGE